MSLLLLCQLASLAAAGADNKLSLGKSPANILQPAPHQPSYCAPAQSLCQEEYAQLFPGTKVEGDGPCMAAMSAGFLPNTCTTEQCSPYLERMLAACTGQKIPNVPPMNHLRGEVRALR